MKLFTMFLAFITVALAIPKIYSEYIEYGQSKPRPRMFGGHEATPHSLPYHALLYTTDYFSGALISQNYILTGATFVSNQATVQIILGAHNRTFVESTQVKMTSNEILIHPDYDNHHYNNIAIIRLPLSVRLTPAIKPISLPSLDDIFNDYSGALSTASSWILTNSDGTQYMSDVLNHVQVNVISNTKCSTFYNDIIYSVLCTSGEGGICHGDTGSLLVTDGVLIGITTFFSKNCPDPLPSGFTRITSFISWIVANTDV